MVLYISRCFLIEEYDINDIWLLCYMIYVYGIWYRWYAILDIWFTNVIYDLNLYKNIHIDIWYTYTAMHDINGTWYTHIYIYIYIHVYV